MYSVSPYIIKYHYSVHVGILNGHFSTCFVMFVSKHVLSSNPVSVVNDEG